MKNKIIFLDHDGVICLGNNFGSRHKKWIKYQLDKLPMNEIPIIDRFDNFDKKAIKILNSIIEETDCDIVTSSDWIKWATVEEMGEYYLSQGLLKKPIDFIPQYHLCDVDEDYISKNKHEDLEFMRCHQIKKWIMDNNPYKWVAIDDLPLGGEKDWNLSNFVYTPRTMEGIKQSGIKEKVLKFLT